MPAGALAMGAAGRVGETGRLELLEGRIFASGGTGGGDGTGETAGTGGTGETGGTTGAFNGGCADRGREFDGATGALAGAFRGRTIAGVIDAGGT